VRVLVVDDSAVFRTVISKVVESIPNAKLAGTAANGEMAIKEIQNGGVDLVTLDLNMPIMDGLTFLKRARELKLPVKTIVFCARSPRSAEDTIQALSLGAVDFVVKPESQNAFSAVNAIQMIQEQLAPKISQFITRETFKVAVGGSGVGTGGTGAARFSAAVPARDAAGSFRKVDPATFKPSAIVIASSTGGPGALERAFSFLNGAPKVPIFIAQHMPEMFTKFLAARIADVAKLECREAENGEVVSAGKVYVAPGNFHMRLSNASGMIRVMLDQNERVHSVRPAADLLFTSAAQLYGPKLGAFVFTGMGEDGARGAVDVKQAGGCVVIQDKETCVVWGMPGATYERGAFDKMVSLNECGEVLRKFAQGT
jgi:two-component system chemotaxis response regulator CheB